MKTETVLPVATPVAEAGEQTESAAPEQQTEAQVEAKPEGEAKPEKTPEQREIERMRRKIDRLVRQREELRARVPGDLRERPIGGTNEEPQGDSDQLTLSRAQIQELIKAEAARLAPKLNEERAVIEHRQKVVSNLAKSWGQEKFDSLAAELEDTFGGLADARGQPKPATDAIFEAGDPKAVIEYLTDPEHSEEAEAIGRMNAVKAGMAIARIESRLKTSKPQASNAPKPLEAVRGQGGVSSKRLIDLEGDDFDKRRREQIKARR